MSNIDMQSVLKAGGIGAGVAIVLGLLALIPVIGPVIGFVFLCGGFLIPIASGILYGYFAPGEEDSSTAAIGGALAGGASGILLSVFSAITSAISAGVSDGVGAGLAGGAISGTIGAICFGLLGFILGAIGGFIWPLIQKQMGGS